MQVLQAYFRIIEKAILKVGIDPEKCRAEKAGRWSLQKGSINIMIDVWLLEKEQKVYFQVVAPIMQVPKGSNSALTEELLGINHGLFGAAFSIFQKVIYLKVTREIEGLDVSEAYQTILRVGNYADYYDDVLKAKYPYHKPVGFQTNRNNEEKS
ncbi:MAG: YbjN domain-containing protein [Chitinophagales bacterium]